MNVLVTGGAGYIGSHVCVDLLNRGDNIFIIDSLINSHETTVASIEKLANKELIFSSSDITDLDKLNGIFNQYHFDAIIHFAALKSVPDSFVSVSQYYDVNVNGTLNLLNLATHHGIKDFIFSSSAAVYGDPISCPLDEKHPLLPKSPYATTKMMGECIVADFARNSKNMRAISLRYFNPIGAHRRRLIGDNPKGIQQNIMPAIIAVIEELSDTFKIFGDDYPTADGTCIRDYIDVCDLASGHICALDFLADKPPGFVENINLGTGYGFSVLEILSEVSKIIGYEIPREVLSRRPGDASEVVACVDKAKKMMGWSSSKTLSDMCLSALHFKGIGR